MLQEHVFIEFNILVIVNNTINLRYQCLEDRFFMFNACILQRTNIQPRYVIKLYLKKV